MDKVVVFLSISFAAGSSRCVGDGVVVAVVKTPSNTFSIPSTTLLSSFDTREGSSL